MTAQSKSLVIYRTESQSVEIPIINETVWLSQKQIAQIFGTQVPAIAKHIGNIFKSGELEKNRTISKMETVNINISEYITNT